MPYKSFEWGYAAKLPLLSLQDTTTLRILEIPVGDYTGETMREVLEATLNNGAFQGSIPEGSGQRYVVEGGDLSNGTTWIPTRQITCNGMVFIELHAKDRVSANFFGLQPTVKGSSGWADNDLLEFLRKLVTRLWTNC